MKKIISHFAKDNRFEISNNQKYNLVIGMTGVGKSSFVNFMTGKDDCKVSNSALPCTQEYKMVEYIYSTGSSYKTLYFIDTPGLDDPKGDKKNIEEIIKFRNAFPRINTIIFCQKIDDNRFSQSTKILCNLMKDLYPDPNIFEHFIIIRTKSDRSCRDFNDNRKASIEFINQLKTEFQIDNDKTIRQFYIDSKYSDNDTVYEKKNILDLLSKIDPLFMRIKIIKIDEVIIYDSLNNRYEIKEKREVEYTDFDGKKDTKIEIDSQIQDFNGINEVEVERKDNNISKGCLWCKSWKIIYTIYHITKQNKRIKSIDIVVWQSEKNDNKSNEIKREEEIRLKINN